MVAVFDDKEEIYKVYWGPKYQGLVVNRIENLLTICEKYKYYKINHDNK